ncbi:uncharacterized protein [Euwallacea fornicatus]|uniref:uncharacterized protein isoform X1 n=1 Tax=Euwallacea fornicatus TaxID=995702 RepID=UPI00338EF155
MIEEEACSSTTSKSRTKPQHKPSKKGLIFLSSIPPYMNVTKLREIFSKFGKVGRIYLHLEGGNKDSKSQDKKKKKHKMAKKFTEGWVEFDKKCVAKRVAALLNNTQISTRKKSKHYDYMWNMKYLSNFKWTHLHERLTYEKLEKNKRLRGDIQLSKKKTNFFDLNVNKKKDKDSINKEYENVGEILNDAVMGVEEEPKESREEVFQSLLC